LQGLIQPGDEARGVSKVFAGDLAGKEIVDIDGTVLGEVENVVFDLQTGKLIDLVAKPDSELHRQKYREDGKYVLIPFSSVVSIKDYIVVDNSRAIKR
jgi:sporulation protein YlmC with PRC-barrel domain